MLKSFDAVSMEAMRPTAQRIIDEIIEERVAAPQCDFYRDFCLPFASRTLLAVVGVDRIMDPARAHAWSSALTLPITSVQPTREILEAAEAACIEMNALFHAEIIQRREFPQNDLLSRLVQAREQDEQLGEDDIVELFHVLLAGGFETTAKTLALGVDALERAPQQKLYFIEHCHDVDKRAKMIDELGRFTGMLGSVMRRVAVDFEWHGQLLRAGDLAYLVICAANWDPTAFEAPEVLNLAAQRNKRPLSFAPGLHQCLGMFLAKMSLSAAFASFYRAFEGIEALGLFTYGPNFMARHFERMPVRLWVRPG
jgi:cytochrome P450